MKQSIGLVILQIVGVSLGLVSVFWIAGSLPPKIYAIVGIYNVISTFIVVFSNTGFETYAIRNVLAWQQTGENDKVKLIVTQAIAYRTILASFILLPIIGYAAYISAYKFDDQYFGLFILMGLLSIAKAINDATVLLLKAFNKYFAAALVTYSVNVFGKILALILFFKYGFNVYIITIIILPIIVTVPVLYMMRKWINIKGVFYKKNIIEGFRQSKVFALSAYISYVYNFLDQLIISVFMSPEVLGSYTVAKNLLNIGKTFIENIFDPMMQNLVRFKNNIATLHLKLKKIIKVRNILLILSIMFLPFVILFVNEGLSLIRLGHYTYLNYFVIFIYLSQVVHIGLKVKSNYISLMFPSNFYLKLAIINAMFSLLFFILLIVINIKLVFAYIFFTNILILFYSNYLFKKTKKPNKSTLPYEISN